MLIDWFTVGAQALNFLILVWLMKRFLYKPILRAIDEREKRIATELANADRTKTDAQKASDEFKKKNDAFDQERAALFSKATSDAQTERQRLMDQAQTETAAWRATLQETTRNQEQQLRQAIGRKTQQEVFAITRKALTDLAASGLEERLATVFTRRLGEMNTQAKKNLADILKDASQPAVVRSAFGLSAEQRASIQTALNVTLSADTHVRFETVPELICGVELIANGQRFAWSIGDYLTSLEKDVDAMLLKNN